MEKHLPPTQARVTEVLDYDPDTGIFRWRQTRGSRAIVGHIAGSPHNEGYLQIKIDGVNYLCHRLAWLVMTGHWPTRLVDHENTIGTDNRWTNLRQAGHAENAQNVHRAHEDSVTGLLGAAVFGKQFRSTIMVKGKAISLGVHKSAEDAHQAYLSAKSKLHPYWSAGA